MSSQDSAVPWLHKPLKVLFDHNVPRKLRKRLPRHLVTTAAQMGWAQLANGLLLESAERAGFDVFLTGDQGILYQQNHTDRRIPIVMLSSTYWPDVNRYAADIAQAIEQVSSGSFAIVTIKSRP